MDDDGDTGWPSYTPTLATGWYIDDVTLRSGPDVFNNPETLEYGWGDWDTDNYTLWQIGVPTFGPPLKSGSRAHSPFNVAATILNGNYTASSVGRLSSPAFVVPSVDPGSVLVARFWQWYQYGTGDGGTVQISSGSGTNWSAWQTLQIAATNGTSTNWSQVLVDLTSYQGQQVRLGFQHTANSDASVGAGWYLDDLSLSSFVPTPLMLGTVSTNRFTANGQYQYFVINVPPGGHLMINLHDFDGLGVNELYLRRGGLPTPGQYDYRFKLNGAADQSVFAPDAGAGQWYALAYNSSGPVPGDYSLATTFSTGILLESVTPGTLGNSVPGTVTIDGAGFTPDSTVALVKGGVSYVATEVSVVSRSRILADFDFTTIPTNTYALRVVSGTNTAELPLIVVYGGDPRFWSKLTVPSSVGRHAPASIYIEYANVGQVAMPAPLLVLTGTEHPILWAAPAGTASSGLQIQSQRQQSFWTATMPAGWSSTVQFLASGKTAGILQPGETNRIEVAYGGLQAPWSWSPTVQFSLGVLTITNSSPVDWASIKPNMRPTNFTDEQWSALWQNFANRAGATWGDYVRMLNNNAAYLRKLGLNVGDLRDLLAFEFAQADGLNVIRNLASATDAYAPTPGLGLAFGRVFPQSISHRYALGVLGRGWSHNWDFNLSKTAEGDVTVTGPGGSRRLFQPDSRDASHYFSQPGDHGILTPLASGRFSLREPRGLLHTFRSDGKLDYAEDPNGNRISVIWSGDQLTRLNHSTGQSLQFTYAGSFIQSVTDPVGRTTTFTYTGEHLTAASYFDSSTVNYAYNAPSAPHALSQITYPDNTQENFSYDAQGRLGNISDSGGSAVNFGYSGYGAVNLSDTFNNRTKFYLDHHGLLAKVVNPQTNSVQFVYDGEFNLTSLTDPAGRLSAYDYDATGNLVQMTDALGGSTRFSYGGAYNRLAQLTDAKGNVTRYNHDPKGNLNAITYANNTVERWGYDAPGNPITWTNRRSQGIGYQFDTSGRLTAKRYPDGSRAIYAYDSRGNLTLASNYVGAITLAYDAADRLQRITYPGNRWLGYTYDTAGRRTSMTDQLGYRLTYIYDAAGRLERMTNSAGLQLVRYAYDAAGRLALKTLGNGVYTTYGYDVAGQLLTLTNAQPGGTSISFFNYTYDNRGRRVAMVTHYGRWAYGYDDLGQLTRAVLASTSTNVPSQNLTYVYDSLGNRVRTIENGVTTAYAVNNMNQYSAVGAIQMNYDADGSLTQKLAGATTVLAITNNFANRVTGFASTNGQRRFDYDALGFPSVVVRDGVQTYQVHDPAGLGHLVGVYDTSGTLLERQNHAFGTIATADGRGPAFLTFDAIGNASDLTAADASVTGGQVLRPFGEPIESVFAGLSRIGFNGELGVQQEGDLVYMRARCYDRVTGRFVTQDPVNLLGKDISLYRYVHNNPLTRIDPAGLTSQQDAERYQQYLIAYNRFGYQDAAWQFNCFTGDGWTSSYAQDGYDVEWRTVISVASMLAGGDVLPVKYPIYSLGKTIEAVGSLICGAFGLIKVDPDAPDQYIPNTPWGYLSEGFLFSNQEELAALWLAYKDRLEFYDSKEQEISQALDPNELLGPGGYGAQNFVAAGSLLPYRINFENATNALAPAQFVTVQNLLATNLDLATFELSSLGFGDRFFAIPPGSQHYERTETLTMNGFRFQVQIEAGLNLATRTVYATFRSLNPTNGLPPTVDIGFLPPENGTGRGQGHLAYIIRAKSGLATGTEIRNVASIVFDQQPAIATDWKDAHDQSKGIDTNKQALVTIDADLPSSAVSSLPATSSSPSFLVSWSGNDAGAGIAGYDVFVHTNGGAWEQWMANATLTAAVFSGQNNQQYCFYSVARDGVGNVQTAPSPAVCVQTLAGSGATWTLTGSLATGRNSHTATLLPNGKVLVAGGNNGTWLATAELYDPASGTWTTTGSMPVGRFAHTATLLPNGKVLVAGGWTTNAALYDSVTGTWTSSGAMNVSRQFHTATLLRSGKVLVVGGANSSNITVSSAELYDPGSGTWTPTGSMANTRYIHTATLLPNGKVLVTGGWNGSSFPSSAELYDPANGTWTTAGSMNTGRYGHTATLLPGGGVLVAGGQSYGVGLVSNTELYVPATETWALTGALTNIAWISAATVLPSGKVLVTGTAAAYSFNSELYDPALGMWTPTTSMHGNRDGHTATLLPNGQVLAVGGQDVSYLASAELYGYATAPNTNITINERAWWQYTPTVNGSGYTFGLSNAPAGMTVNTNSGVISWTPTEVQGPSTNGPITFAVYQAGTTVAWTNFTVIVNEVNLAPALTVPTAQTVSANALLCVTNSAVDPDIPANALTFAIVSAPSGVGINPDTGVLTWTPTTNQIGSHTITISVT
ncbi:MAG: choice-of-anchor J domain-containing protein, partial [Verrucomicrobia bacterium]|nr:choice-of-anchor J domain-containing protein [Verrucomicrobiota bacterium]